MTDTLGTALVTGASSGIGKVYADRLAKRGYDLVLVARDEARLKALAETLGTETGRKVEVLRADLTDAADLATVAARLADDLTITLLVNNAGMALNGGLLENDAPALERLIALNITAPTILARAVAPGLVDRGGAIVNIASVLAFAPEMIDGVYSGTKAYLLNLTLGLAAKYADSKLRVQAVLPGATRTEIWERSGLDLESFPAEMVMDVDDLVDAALVGFDKGETVTIPPLADEGQYLAYDEARKALAPGLSRRDVAARYRGPAAA